MLDRITRNKEGEENKKKERRKETQERIRKKEKEEKKREEKREISETQGALDRDEISVARRPERGL